MKVGDLAYQKDSNRTLCVVLKVYEVPCEYPGPYNRWTLCDYPIYQVYHPYVGVMEDPHYFYEPLTSS